MSRPIPILVVLLFTFSGIPFASSVSGPPDCAWQSSDYTSVTVGTGPEACDEASDVSLVYCDDSTGAGVGGGTAGVGQGGVNVGVGASEECRPQCSDDVDNDGDGAVDFPEDPGCSDVADDDEHGAIPCDNGLDDDNDGRADFQTDDGGDPGCDAPTDASESGSLVCDDAVDNDDDGEADFKIDGSGDPGCADLFDATERGTTACDNGVDDDNDGTSDFRATAGAGDPGCSGPTDESEKGTIACDNGIDDDADGRIDFNLNAALRDPGCSGPTDADETDPVGGKLVINEVDYDQPGSDVSEYVEILNIGPGTVDLTGIAVVFVNGANNAEYLRIGLSSAGTLVAGQYLVIAQTGVVVAPGAAVLRFANASSNIQNGAPDGIAIFDATQNLVLDALSYEGSITAASISGAPGTYNLVEGAPTSASANGLNVQVLVRLPNGVDTDNAASDWAVTATATPGAPNAP